MSKTHIFKRGFIRPQFVGNDFAGFAIAGHKLFQDFQGSFLVTAFGSVTIENGSFMIDGAPEIEILTIDFDEDFINVPSPV